MLGRGARQLLEQVAAADDVGEFPDSEAAQDFPHIPRQELEVVHDAFRAAVEVLFTQPLVLRGDTGGAIVQVADSQVLAAQGNHRAGAEAETFRAQDSGFDHVQPGFQATVHLQANLVAQAVLDQCLVRFRQPSSHGSPAYFTELNGLAPVPPSNPAIVIRSA